MGPETTNNVCNNDQFIVSGGAPVPIICGLNSGNHSKLYSIKIILVCSNMQIILLSVYIDAGVGMTNPIILTVVTTGPSFPRNWKIRVSQIPCYTSYKGKGIHSI